MSEQVCEGIVEVAVKNKAGFWSIKIGDDWYGSGIKNADLPFSKGDAIRFVYTENGQWKNADPKSFEVVRKTQAASSSESGGDRQKSIVYQHSQEMALRFLDVVVSSDAVKLPAKQADKYDALYNLYLQLVDSMYEDAMSPPSPGENTSPGAGNVEDDME